LVELQEIKRTLSRIEKLEREVHLKQMQINSLLTITQAINENLSAEGLFGMYNHSIRWELGIRKVAFYFREGDVWQCMTHGGVREELMKADIGEELVRYRNKQGLENSQHPVLDEFDLIIPVMHKNTPIAYVLIGGFSEEEDVYNKVQFVTTLSNVIAVAIENKRMFREQLRQEVVNREVELAAEIQKTLVPNKLPSAKQFQLSSIYKPHFAVGGDFYDVVEFPDGKIVFCIADITGKGVAAALLMANFQANFRALVARRPTLEELVQEMNAAVFRVTQGDRFITLFVGKYDPEAHTIHYINAGHAPPLLLSNGEATLLKNGCTVLGWMPELPFLELGGICLSGEALLFTYTDGLTDVRNDAGEDFDENKLLDFLWENVDMEVYALNAKLLHHLERFRGKQSYPDDITVLTCKLFSASNATER